MRIFSTIDNKTTMEWGLSLQEAYLFEWMYSLPSWATSAAINGKTFYFASKKKAVEDLPIITTKLDTMYRYYKTLAEKGLIEITKIDNKDYVCLTEKSKKWNSLSYPEKGGKSERSDGNPENGRIEIRHIDILDNIEREDENSFSSESDSPDPDSTPPKNGSVQENLFLMKQEDFKKSLFPFVDTQGGSYTASMVKKFYEYWSEPNSTRRKMRWQMEKTWDTSRRLAKWAFNDEKFNKKKGGSASNLGEVVN